MPNRWCLDQAVLWNRITLLAVVRGNEVTHPFTVTEVHKRQEHGWTMLAMTFSSVRSEHRLEHGVISTRHPPSTGRAQQGVRIERRWDRKTRGRRRDR